MMYVCGVVSLPLILTVLISPVCCTLQCYSGSVGATGHSLDNTTCDHTLSHMFPVMGSDNNLTYMQVNYSLHHPDNDNSADIEYCVIFKFSDSDKTDYHCDYDYICPPYVTSPTNKKTIQGVTLKGNLGTLHCCGQKLCNDRSIGSSLTTATTSFKCYHGNTTTYTTQDCVGSRWCLRSTVLEGDAGVSVMPYSCDTQGQCDAHSLADGQCTHKTDPQSGVNRRICCCNTNLCNKDGLMTAPPGGKMTTPLANTIGIQPLSAMPSHLPPNQSLNYRHWMFIGGIAAGIMFGTLMFIIVAIVIKRYKQQRDTQLTYSYTQLTADLAEDRETDDERMLVG